jgi:hypothetical protein
VDERQRSKHAPLIEQLVQHRRLAAQIEQLELRQLVQHAIDDLFVLLGLVYEQVA